MWVWVSTADKGGAYRISPLQDSPPLSPYRHNKRRSPPLFHTHSCSKIAPRTSFLKVMAESNGAFTPFRGYSRRELKEQDLISQLELGSQYDSEEVDCTLQLGLPSGNGGKRPRIDVPNNIHATPPPQNHGVANGQYGYYNMSMGNLGVSNMNIWAPMNPNGGYYYGSTSAVAATVIPIGYDNAGMYPRTGEPDPRSVPNERICVVCGSTSTPLWRNGPRGAKTLCNACGIRFKNEMRRASQPARGHHGTRSRASMAVPNPNEPGTFTNRP